MKIMYVRVSTLDQNTDLQIRAGREEGAERFFEEKVSGKNTNRPEFKRMLDQLRAGDTVIVYKLDRLARSTFDLLETIRLFDSKNVGFKSLSEAWADTTTPHGRLMITIFGGLAEFEREIIRERQRDGIEEARRQGKHLGRKKKLSENEENFVVTLWKGKASLSEIGKRTGISPRTVSRILERRGEKA